MREKEKIEHWVVYQAVQGAQSGIRSVCKQSEWEAVESRQPGVNKLVQAGITSESEAEKLARGTSGDLKKREPKIRSGFASK
ncbi:MAG: hypothetical protein HY290_31575 [Planctomycetia bacterium]|nr:hypothetical protein [Planctomycetia bacterium]